MSKTGSYGAFAIFALALVAGLYGGARSWKGVVYLADSRSNSGRNPAAIKRELDFSRLDGAELVTATQKRLVTAAKTIMQDGLVGVELGHFVTRDEHGERRLACDSFYNRITLRFDAEGIASAGEKPAMEIDGPCQTSSKDIASIEPIWIPVEKIMENRPADMDIDFYEGVKFKFDHMGSQWPVSWSLQSVRLYNSTESRHEVKISSRELREIRQRPFVVNWFDPKRVPSAAH